MDGSRRRLLVEEETAEEEMVAGVEVWVQPLHWDRDVVVAAVVIGEENLVHLGAGEVGGEE